MLEGYQINYLLYNQTSLDIYPKKKSLYIYRIQIHIRRKSTDISKEVVLNKLMDPKLKITCNSLKSATKIDARKQTN